MVVKPAVRTSDSSTAVPLTIHCALRGTQVPTTTLFGVGAIKTSSAAGAKARRLHGSFLSLPAAMANLMPPGC